MGFQERLLQVLTKEQIYMEEPMSRHTTFRVGGPAEYYVKPLTTQVAEVVKLCKEEQMMFYIIGNGSNLLVGDRGVRGVVIEIGAALNEINIEGNVLYVQAGVSLVRMSLEAAKAGLSGLEFASGIPGTVGGAIVMNAGAYGGEIKDVLKWAQILCEDGSIRQLSAEELELSYRHSSVPQMKGIVLKAAFELRPEDETLIRAQMELLRNQRNQKQPLDYPSAGSTFKRPEGHFAGKLIMDAGLRGYQVGGAQVSEKHCGFVINKENATARDILNLMKDVQEKVQKDFGVWLEPEVKMIGEF